MEIKQIIKVAWYIVYYFSIVQIIFPILTMPILMLLLVYNGGVFPENMIGQQRLLGAVRWYTIYMMIAVVGFTVELLSKNYKKYSKKKGVKRNI